jgi:phosphoglycerate dehydrogenase-like enzyme
VDVLLCSGLWRNELIPAARRLAFIQSISAGTDQYSRDALGAGGIRVASAQSVNEPALVEALTLRRIAGAARDYVREEPLPATSGLCGVPNVLITPPTAGETRRYEGDVIDLLLENLERLWRGEPALKHQFV